MKMIRAIIRPEKVSQVLQDLAEADFPAVTKIDVFGRGKQRGVKVGNVHYDEIPKELLMMVVRDEDKDDVIQIITKSAKTGDGTFGDGKIFISDVEEVYTISSGASEL
ncbi:nitrogen regulatory protein P-II family [Natranaerovirga pectinivora]|uniref:Nitrogen regulatory protein P-II family n=1 Tax=Natranaerovirga pectinivora TaxID=682400 RepID=A0A4R3ML25_9FIRM|nr:P-II family nitrogen regulator [Natranaerovirga pectinivora]TCT15308.1 nitrogen regulatory protein P-II family [Natranaerovirga pectinivora]